MHTQLHISIFAIATAATLLTLLGPSQAQTVRLPEFTVTDQTDTVVGAFFSAGSTVSSPSENFVRVLQRDTTNDENYNSMLAPTFYRA